MKKEIQTKLIETKYKITDGEFDIYATVDEECDKITLSNGGYRKGEDTFVFRLSDRKTLERIGKLISEASNL